MADVTIAEVAADRGLIGGPFGSNLVSGDYVESGIPVIRGANMFRREVGGEYVYVSQEKFDRDLLRNNAEPGDLIFTQRGTLGQVSLVPEVPYAKYVVSQSQMRLRVNPGIAHPKYVYYAASSPSFMKQVYDNAISAGVPHINLGILSRLKIPMWPLVEQLGIVEVLGVLDEKIATNDHMARTALSLGDALFVAGLRRDPGTSTTIGELADRGVLALGDGYRTKQTEYGRPGFRILRAGDVRDGCIIPEGGDFVSESYSRQIGPKVSRANDIVLTTKGTVGRVAVVPPGIEAVVYSPQICYFRVLDEETLDRGYLAAWFRSSNLENQASQLMFKSDMAPYINLRDIRSLVIPLPGLAELRKQGELQRGLLDVIHTVHSENRRLERTRDELLPLLISGKVRVRDAEKVAERVV